MLQQRPLSEPVGPGRESVWSYPRPATLELCPRRIRIVFGGETIAETVQAWRVLETSHPPNYYLPLTAFAPGVLQPTSGQSLCEWKGMAHYYDLCAGEKRAARAGWGYAEPTRSFAAIQNHVAVYPGMMEACYVDDQLVTPQPGGFYGGWITPDVVGPFKGEAGTEWW